MLVANKIIKGKRGYGSISRFLLGLFLMLLLASCGDDVCGFPEEDSGYTKEQLEEGIALKFSEKAWGKLIRKREEAFALDHHFKEKGDYVKAKMTCDGERIKIKVRFKGGGLDHLEGRLWSLKLKKGKKSKKPLGLGHYKLGLLKPSSKNYLLEYLFQRVCKAEDILALQYFFVPVTINDTLQGTYAIESVIGNQTLRDGHRELAPILKFDKKPYGKRFYAGEKSGIDSVEMLKARILTSNTKWCKRQENIDQCAKAKQVLSHYRKGELQPDKVFDYEVFARYVAICELFGSSHSLRWLNLRFYFHPESNRFEPIAFDCFDGRHPRNEILWYNEEKRFEYFLHPLLDDLEFQKKVEKYLKEYCEMKYIKGIFSSNHTELTKYMKLIRKDKNDYILSRDHMLQRGKHILSTLN